MSVSSIPPSFLLQVPTLTALDEIKLLLPLKLFLFRVFITAAERAKQDIRQAFGQLNYILRLG